MVQHCLTALIPLLQRRPFSNAPQTPVERERGWIATGLATLLF